MHDWRMAIVIYDKLFTTIQASIRLHDYHLFVIASNFFMQTRDRVRNDL